MNEESDEADDSTKLATLRDLLPATGAGIYLDTADRGPMPSETAAAMREADDWELRVGRAWEGRDDDVTQRHDEARAVLAAMLGADPDAITITPGLEAAAELVQRHLGVEPEQIVRHVHPGTGQRLEVVRGEGRPLVVDVSLSIGAIPLAIEDLGADAVIFATDRWLLGPEAVAAVWLRHARPNVGMALARTQLIGLARTVGWLEMYVGLEWMFARAARLAGHLHAALIDLPGVEMVTPADEMATIICFRLPAWPLDDALTELRRRVFAIVSHAPGGDAIRASVSWFNTDEELDRFAAAVAEIARHTPDSLPRRLPLIVH
jgi:selenocysteine lyase/cysteine desulfurase